MEKKNVNLNGVLAIGAIVAVGWLALTLGAAFAG